jgi:hypothetical protein
MSQNPKIARPLRWYVYEGDVQQIVKHMLDVQRMMTAYDHSIGAVDLRGLAYGWNIHSVLREFQFGSRKAFLRCVHCAQPGIINPEFNISGFALSNACLHATNHK